jgi:proteasome lid subunit RPN8/RPN11
MLAGFLDGLVVEHYPLVNALADPRRFESDARSMFEAEKRRREEGLEFLATYHSHPTSPAVPSRLDLELNYSEEIMSLIISLLPPRPSMKGYWLTSHGFREAEFTILAPPPAD